MTRKKRTPFSHGELHGREQVLFQVTRNKKFPQPIRISPKKTGPRFAVRSEVASKVAEDLIDKFTVAIRPRERRIRGV